MATRMWQRIRETGDFDMIHSHYGMFRYAPVGPRAGQDKELGANATKVIANGNEM